MAVATCAVLMIARVAVSAPAGADFAGTSLHAYLERAAGANPDLRAFEDRYRAALERVPQASALPDPRLQVTHFVESVQTRTGRQENAILLSQMIPWFGKLGRRKEAAAAEAEALWFMYQNRQLVVARTVSAAFFEYGFTGKAIELTRENLDLLRRLEPVVEERVRAGGDLNPLLRLRVEIGRIDDRLRTFGRNRLAQSARLAGMLAVDTGVAFPWPEWEAPEPAAPDAAAFFRALEAGNPELAMLDRKVASARARQALARMESLPDLTVGVNYIELDAYANSTLPDAGRDPWGVVIGVNLPLWGGRNKAVRDEMRFSESAAANERRDRENMLKAELSASLASLEDANRRLTLYGDTLLQLARQAVEITQASYEGGRATILEVIDSERSLLELHLQFWRAAADAWQQRIVLQTLTNQPIAGGFSPAGSAE